MFIAAQFTIAKCWKQPQCPSVNEWTKKLWYIYTMEFYAEERKEGAPTFHDSMDGTGEHYAKWNKPGSEGQIPYDPTFNWNIINKRKKQAKYNQRHRNKEQTNSNQRGGGKGIMESKERVVKKHVWKAHGQGQRVEGGGWMWWWGWVGQGRVMGGKWGQLHSNNTKK